MFDALKDRFENIFAGLRGKGKLSEEDINNALREVRRALLEADVNYKVVKDVVEAIRTRATGKEVLDSVTPVQLIFTVVYEELIKIIAKIAIKKAVLMLKIIVEIVCKSLFKK